MDTNRFYNEVHGLVIHEMKYKNTSKILRVFTRELGKISILSQGAMRPGSDKASLSNLFGMNNYCLSKGKSFYYIRSGEPLHSFHRLSQNLSSVVCASFVCELLDRTMLEESPYPEVFGLTQSFFEALLITQPSYSDLLIAFIYKFVAYMGYRPDFTGCLSCGTSAESAYQLSISRGGVICRHCGGAEEGLYAMNRLEFRHLNQLLYLPLVEGTAHGDSGLSIDRKKLLGAAIAYLLEVMELEDLRVIPWLQTIKIL